MADDDDRSGEGDGQLSIGHRIAQLRSERKTEAAKLRSEGKTYAEIAEQLGVSKATIVSDVRAVDAADPALDPDKLAQNIRRHGALDAADSGDDPMSPDRLAERIPRR
jgi:DNA-binding CsgD family transcriptional regulator